MGKNSVISGYCQYIKTRYGRFLLVFTQKGLWRVFFPGTFRDNDFSDATLNQPPPSTIRKWMEISEKALINHLNGIPPEEYPPFDLSAGTAFSIKVWDELQKISWGKTATYGEIARKLGNPKLSRAVGVACGANPIPIFIPCHRVIAADGSLGGFTAGLVWKKRLLEIESKDTSIINP